MAELVNSRSTAIKWSKRSNHQPLNIPSCRKLELTGAWGTKHVHWIHWKLYHVRSTCTATTFFRGHVGYRAVARDVINVAQSLSCGKEVCQHTHSTRSVVGVDATKHVQLPISSEPTGLVFGALVFRNRFCMASCSYISYHICYIYILYLSAHVQRTKQALGIAPHEALFKKNKHTKSLLRHSEGLLTVTNLFHIFLIVIPAPLSLHAPSKIIANFSSSAAASNSPPLWVPLPLSISSSLSSCHLAHFKRKCFASSTSCPLPSLHFLSSLPSPFHLPVSMHSCAVAPLSLVTILLTSLLSICALLPLQSLYISFIRIHHVHHVPRHTGASLPMQHWYIYVYIYNVKNSRI